MLIGLDFDNTIACYDGVFSSEAKIKGFVQNEWRGTKQDLKPVSYTHLTLPTNREV